MQQAEEQWEQGVVFQDVPPFEAGSAWDDAAIIKAFDDALSLHRTRRQDARGEKATVVAPKQHAKKPGAKQATSKVKFNLQADEQEDPRTGNGGQSASTENGNGSSDSEPEEGAGDNEAEDYTEADTRFEALLRKNQAAPARPHKQRVRGAGIPGEWQPVEPQQPKTTEEPATATDVQPDQANPEWAAAWAAYYNQTYHNQQQQPPHSQPHRQQHLYPGYAQQQQQYQQYWPYSQPYYNPYTAPQAPPNLPTGSYPPASAPLPGAFAQPPPPPPTQAMPTTGYDTELDEALADVLLSWYYSGYYTGRLRAVLERRR